MTDTTRRLMPREIEALRGLARGEQTADIARRLGVTKGTVRSYYKALYARFDVQTREEVVAAGRHHGYVTDACPTCGRP